MYTLIHNTNCSKSNEAFKIMTEAKVAFEVRNYLTDPLSEKELSLLLNQLNLPALAIVRTNETLWQAQYADQILDDAAVIKILAQRPELLQRPIIVHQDSAIIGRPTSNILSFLNLS